MKADLENDLIKRLFGFAMSRMKENRVTPTANSVFRGEYRCAFSEGTFFSSGLTSENVLILLNTINHDVNVFVVSPLVLRRIRELLLYEGDFVVLHNSMMPAKLFFSWVHILEMSYTVRQLAADAKYVFDMREWVGDVKIAMTGDWSSEAVSLLRHGKLDMDYVSTILTTLFDVKVIPIKLYYSTCIMSMSRGGTSEMFGFMITPSHSEFEGYFDRFRGRYGTRYGAGQIIDEGVLQYDNIRDMYEALTPIVARVNSIQERGGMLDLSVCAGLRIFSPSYNRFLFRWEES